METTTLTPPAPAGETVEIDGERFTAGSDGTIEPEATEDPSEAWNRSGRRHPERKRSKHTTRVRRGWQKDGETVAYGPMLEVSRTKRLPWTVKVERRAGNRRTRIARRVNR